jgi:hypothetical protein
MMMMIIIIISRTLAVGANSSVEGCLFSSGQTLCIIPPNKSQQSKRVVDAGTGMVRIKSFYSVRTCFGEIFTTKDSILYGSPQNGSSTNTDSGTVSFLTSSLQQYFQNVAMWQNAKSSTN